MDINNFQRVGSVSNAHVGRDFESVAKEYYRQQGISLDSNYSVPVGVASEKKNRQFDLGSGKPAILIECKSHRWTAGGNVPSAKITVWNEAMYFFHLAALRFRKVLFVLRDYSKKRGETLAAYYTRNYVHLIPSDVEILEYDEESSEVIAVLTSQPR
ncbi:MAG: hypothetical protein K9J81_11555 [Desulfohalobiaceae bacterium]|nr:hypothetical protein [Desulfohalobiaceae bacterium]